MPLTNWQADTTKKAEGFKKGSFIYYEEEDCYICPQGCILRYGSFCRSTGLHLYRSDAGDCACCPERSKCISGEGNVRSVSRHPNEESRERNIARCHTDAGRAILKSRKHIVEPPFGHMKTYGGLGLISSRGKAKANVKVVMAAVAYNLVKLVEGRSPRTCLSACYQALLGHAGRALRVFGLVFPGQMAACSQFHPHPACCR